MLRVRSNEDESCQALVSFEQLKDGWSENMLECHHRRLKWLRARDGCEDGRPWNYYSPTYIISLRVLFPKICIIESLWNQIAFEIEFWAPCHKIFLFGDWQLSILNSQSKYVWGKSPELSRVLWLRLVWIFCDLVKCVDNNTPLFLKYHRENVNLSSCKLLQQILF